MRNKDKQLKFDVGCEHNVTIKTFTPEQDDYGVKNVYEIEELNGKDHFVASKGLHDKINKLGAVNNDRIKISKIIVEGYADGNPFFKVETSDVPLQKHISVEKFEKQFDKPLTVQETPALKDKIDVLAKKVEILWNERDQKDDDLPF